MMDGDWKRLGRAVRARRRSLGYSRAAFAAIAQVSDGTIKNLETGAGYTRMPDTLPEIQRALGWTSASALTVLRGGDPTYSADEDAAQTDMVEESGELSWEERAEMIRELRELKAKTQQILARLGDADAEAETDESKIA